MLPASAVRSMPLAVRVAMALYWACVVLVYITAAFTVLGVHLWSNTKYAVYAVCAPFAAYVLMRLSMFVFMAVAVRNGVTSAVAPEVVGFDRKPDEARVRRALAAVTDLDDESVQWMARDVDDWLAADPGVPKDRKRNALLERLYAYAGSSKGYQKLRTAANELRLAINPWIDEKKV